MRLEYPSTLIGLAALLTNRSTAPGGFQDGQDTPDVALERLPRLALQQR
jgi:hypothetical protein